MKTVGSVYFYKIPNSNLKIPNNKFHKPSAWFDAGGDAVVVPLNRRKKCAWMLENTPIIQ